MPPKTWLVAPHPPVQPLTGVGNMKSQVLPRRFLTRWTNNTDRRITVDSTLKERKAVAAVRTTTGRPASALCLRLRAVASVGIVHRDLAKDAADGASDTWRASGKPARHLRTRSRRWWRHGFTCYAG